MRSFKTRLALFVIALLGIGALLLALSSSIAKRRSQHEPLLRSPVALAAAPSAPLASSFVHIDVTERGFAPSSVTLRPGVPTELEFLRTTEETCASSVVFPELGVSKPLALNEPVRLTVPPLGPRTLSFQCGIGDHRSAVIIN